tara:strand:+ start:12837 stop:14801 length:1965 start_codon:yes stop_codon:yes gene_type:complete
MNPSTTDSARNFLAEIFEPEGEPLTVGRIAVWNKVTHDTTLARDADDAAEIALRPENANVIYFGVCSRNPKAIKDRSVADGTPMKKIQGDRHELSGMPGLWVDIDSRSPGHAKASLAPTVDAALDALARAVPVKPTIIVRTGGGIHAYWLFSEGVIPFAKPGNSNSREDLEMLCRSFQAMVRDELQKSGWADDQTWALPRVMRLPGGQNVSHGTPYRDVTWDLVGPRYSVEDLQAVIPADLELVEPQKVHPRDDRMQFVISDLNPTTRKDIADWVLEICDIDGDFATVWNRKRRSLPSQSDMDMSIATRLACCDTPAQRIVDALRIHRLEGNPGDPKANRSDYYLMTLQKAYGASDQDRRREDTLTKAIEIADEAARGILLFKGGDPGHIEESKALLQSSTKASDDLRTEALAVVNESFGLKDHNRIVKVIRDRGLNGATELWRFVFASGSMRGIKGAQLMNCMAIRTEITLATNVMPEPFTTKPNKPRQWGSVLAAIGLAAQYFDEGTDKDRVCRSMIRHIEGLMFNGSEELAAPFSEAWHLDVAVKKTGLLWRSKSGLESGVLIRRGIWLDFLKYDPEGVSSSVETPSGWSTLLEHSDGVEAVRGLGFTKECGKRGTARGYLRVTRRFIEEHGGDAVVEMLDEAIALKAEES